MKQVPDDQNSISPAWNKANLFMMAAAVLLLIATFALLLIPLLKRPEDKLDPQSQIGTAWLKPPGGQVGYAGNEACRNCHPNEYKLYSASPHAHTVQVIPPGEDRPEFGLHQAITDELTGTVYTVSNGIGKNQLSASTKESVENAAARWVFGSGVQALTYLAQNDSDFLQLRTTYYPPSKTWNFTPGSGPGTPYHQALGDPFTPLQAAACFGCHSTVVTGTPQRLDLEHSLLNVGCESCHGPARNHIDSVTASHNGVDNAPNVPAGIVKPPLHKGPDNVKFCGNCHRVPVAVADESKAAEKQLARFPGVALPRSRCFIESAEKLTCITCHNPHESTKQQQETSFDQKCIDCHTPPRGSVCSLGKTSRCVTCHMPEEQITTKLPLRFHNHWIRKNPAAQK